jgi:hypothetical protein
VTGKKGDVTVANMQFNHLELTFARGTLNAEFRADVEAFYGSVFGWKVSDVDLLGQTCLLLRPDDVQFILLAEYDRPLSSPGYDHVGLLQPSRADVDALAEVCRTWADKDDRVKLKLYDDLVTGNVTTHAFYVKFLLPLYFDVQHLEYVPGSEPAHRWQYI